MTVERRYPLLNRAAQIDGNGALNIPGLIVTAASATAGGASALPATPAGYFLTVLNGTTLKVAYYNT